MSLPRAFVIVLFAQVFVLGVRETLDPDMWWHLRTGKVIATQGLPRHDVFSFTVPGHEWIVHEWLADVLAWVVYSFGGLPALSILFAAITAIAFGLVYAESSGRPYLAAAVMLLAAAAAAPSIGVRPQVLNLLGAAVFVRILEAYRSGRQPVLMLVLLPMLTILWANLHSGYLAGVSLIGVYAAGQTLEREDCNTANAEWARERARWLALAAAGCFAAALVTPYGWKMWRFPVATLTSDPIQQNIAEWLSPDFHQPMYWPFAVLLALAALGWALSPVRPRWTDLLLVVGAGAAGLVSRRHIAVFAIVTLPPITRAVTGALEGTRAGARLVRGRSDVTLGTRRALNWALVGIGVPCAALWSWTRLARNETAITRAFPAAAVDYLEREGLATQRGYNTYAWGGYLIWRGLPVFVDGRAEVYGNTFLSNYLKTYRLAEGWRAPLDQYEVTYVLVERSNPLATLLTVSQAWRESYADDVARVFVRAPTP